MSNKVDINHDFYNFLTKKFMHIPYMPQLTLDIEVLDKINPVYVTKENYWKVLTVVSLFTINVQDTFIKHEDAVEAVADEVVGADILRALKTKFLRPCIPENHQKTSMEMLNKIADNTRLEIGYCVTLVRTYEDADVKDMKRHMAERRWEGMRC